MPAAAVIAQAINDKAAHAFALTMIAQVDIFVDQLSVSSRDGRPVDMTDRCKRLGMVIVGLLAFGYLLHMQTDETNRFMLRGLSIGTWQNNSFMQFPLLKKLGMHHLLLLHGYYQRRMYKRTLQTMIRRRLSEEKHAQNDLYSFVADRLDNASDGMTTTDLWAEALFFIPAGPCPKRAWLGPVPRRRTCDTARDRGGRLHVFPSPPRRLLSGPVCFSTGALARRRRRYASTNAFGLLPLFRGRSGVRGKTHGLLRSEPRVCQDALALRFRGGPREGRRGRRGCFGADGRTRKGRTSLSCTTPLVPSTKGPTCYFMIVPDPVAILS